MSAVCRQYIPLLFWCIFLLFFCGIPTAVHAQTSASTRIDLIVEPDTLVPDFYQGRTLPARDETIKVTAIPQTAASVSPDQYTYTWKLNGTILFGGPVPGLFRTDVTMPNGTAILEVIVYTNSGALIGNTLTEIEPAEPELLFYENNPLRSMSRQAFGDVFTLVGDEVSVRAEPYFVAENIFDIDPVITWHLDGREIQNFGGDPRTLVLRGTGGSGQSRVGFDMVNPVSLQSLDEAFTIYFEN